MGNNEWLEISSMQKFTDYIRTMVYMNFAENTEENDLTLSFKELSKKEQVELNNLLDIEECILIVKENVKIVRHKINKEKKYLINDTRLNKIIEDINQRMISNIIKDLVGKGLLETAFDEEKNDFVFWAKKDNKE